MSLFSVIMLGIVSYFIIGGFITGLIVETFEFKENVLFWPVHVIRWCVELVDDVREGAKEFLSSRRAAYD
jgi:hypothetical protein